MTLGFGTGVMGSGLCILTAVLPVVLSFNEFKDNNRFTSQLTTTCDIGAKEFNRLPQSTIAEARLFLSVNRTFGEDIE